ncbi:MAG: hypothetical protein U9R58_05060 [Chloroflexota bacterium]|nr:hypothetical protein [Chloroflexota bacterium]
MKRHSIALIAMITFVILLYGCSLPRSETPIPTATQLPSPEAESATPTTAAEEEQPEITPTSDDATSTSDDATSTDEASSKDEAPTTDTEAILAALAEQLDMDVDELDASVSEIRGLHAKGSVENGYFIAAKSNDQWVIVYAGQATPYCVAIELYDFPVDMVPECLDEDDNLVVRTEPTEEPLSQTLGPPTWSDDTDTGANWYMVHTDNVRFSMQDGMLEMKVLKAGGYEEWGMATVPHLGDFYLEVEFDTGDQCSGLDRYGVIIRAPEPNKGYIFEFSCDGHYRFYKWDGSNYISMLEWTSAAAINPGSNQTNRLGVSATGEVFKLYANDKYLNEAADGEYDSGKFGLLVGSANTDNLKVYVDAASYWLIEDQD